MGHIERAPLTQDYPPALAPEQWNPACHWLICEDIVCADFHAATDHANPVARWNVISNLRWLLKFSAGYIAG
jgi:hypothetical protein